MAFLLDFKKTYSLSQLVEGIDFSAIKSHKKQSKQLQKSLKEFVSYIDSLQFNEDPNYEYMQGLLEQCQFMIYEIQEQIASTSEQK